MVGGEGAFVDLPIRACPTPGGIEDKTASPTGPDEQRKRLILRGTAVLGGISVRNQAPGLQLARSTLLMGALHAAGTASAALECCSLLLLLAHRGLDVVLASPGLFENSCSFDFFLEAPNEFFDGLAVSC